MSHCDTWYPLCDNRRRGTAAAHSNQGDEMNKSYVWQLAVFVLILLGLNFFFRLHISIIGSLVLTVGLSLLFSFFRGRR